MNKLRIITCDCEEEAEANLLRAIAEQKAIERTVLEAGNATCHITVEALSQLEDDNSKKRSKTNGDVNFKVEGALKAHAAQLAASQFPDGTATSA
eukprot:5030523-Amphidinium_carterae.1